MRIDHASFGGPKEDKAIAKLDNFICPVNACKTIGQKSPLSQISLQLKRQLHTVIYCYFAVFDKLWCDLKKF